MLTSCLPGCKFLKSATPEEGAKFRAKILGLSAVSEQNSAISFERDEHGDAQDQRDVVTQLQEELNRRQASERCDTYPIDA